MWYSANDWPSDALWRFALPSAISVMSFFFLQSYCLFGCFLGGRGRDWLVSFLILARI